MLAIWGEKKMHVIRKEIMEKLLYNLKYSINTVIIGNNGVGKTSLLKYLESFAPNAYYIASAGPKQMLIQALKSAGINYKSSEISNDLLSKLKSIKGLILLVDDADKLSKPAKRVLTELRAHLIFSSEKELFNDFESLKLKGFNDKELRQYLKSLMLSKEASMKSYNFIKKYSDSSPLSIIKAVNLYEKGLSTKQAFSLYSFTSKRIEVLTVAFIVSIAYLFMSLRFLFYFQKNFQLGYALGTAAYLLFFLFRRRKK